LGAKKIELRLKKKLLVIINVNGELVKCQDMCLKTLL